jgi:hypothetical protein
MKHNSWIFVLLKYTDVSEVHTASTIALMMEEIRTSETSVYFSENTLQYIPEGCRLRIWLSGSSVRMS